MYKVTKITHFHHVRDIRIIKEEVAFRLAVPECRLKWMNSAAPGFYLRLLTHYAARANALDTYGVDCPAFREE